MGGKVLSMGWGRGWRQGAPCGAKREDSSEVITRCVGQVMGEGGYAESQSHMPSSPLGRGLWWCRRLWELLLISAPLARPHVHGV